MLPISCLRNALGALALVIAVSGVGTANDVTLSLSQGLQAVPGETFQVDLHIDDGSQVGGARMALFWDEAVFAYVVDSISTGTCLNHANDDTPGRLIASMACGDELSEGPQVLLSFSLLVLATATCDLEYALTLDSELSRINDGQIPSLWESGTVMVSCAAEPTATETPMVEPTATETPMVEPTATETPMLEPTATETPMVEPTPSETPVVEPTPTFNPDINQDGVVDYQDLLILMRAWHQSVEQP